MVQVNLTLDYIEQLKKRLKKADISHKALAREMGIPPESVSRWMNHHVEPRIGSVILIEEAILRILKQRDREKARQDRKAASA